MPDGIGQPPRREVAARAGGRCEYCLVPGWALLASCEVDHVISRKHGSIVPETGQFSRLFNPRTDRWTKPTSIFSESMGARGGCK